MRGFQVPYLSPIDAFTEHPHTGGTAHSIRKRTAITGAATQVRRPTPTGSDQLAGEAATEGRGPEEKVH